MSPHVSRVDLRVSRDTQEEDESYLSDLFEGFGVKVGEDVAVRLREDLEGHGAVMVLQGGDVVVADRQLRSGVDLVPEDGGQRSERPATIIANDAE